MAMSLVAWTTNRRMAMHARETLLLAPTVANAASCLPRPTQQASLLFNLCQVHQRRHLPHHPLQDQLPRRLPHQLLCPLQLRNQLRLPRQLQHQDPLPQEIVLKPMQINQPARALLTKTLENNVSGVGCLLSKLASVSPKSLVATELLLQSEQWHHFCCSRTITSAWLFICQFLHF